MMLIIVGDHLTFEVGSWSSISSLNNIFYYNYYHHYDRTYYTKWIVISKIGIKRFIVIFHVKFLATNLGKHQMQLRF